MDFLKNIFYKKKTRIIFQAFYIKTLFLWLLTGYCSINAQITRNSVLLPKTYEIDSVIIRARKESRDLMEKPYTEPGLQALGLRTQGS